MPSALTYPGVYIEEVPSGVRTITGVPTSITAFVGRAWRGPVDSPTLISSFAEYDRTFGGLWRDSTMGFAVQQFFQNGGSTALIVRAGSAATAGTPATFAFTGGAFAAASPGSWAMNLSVTVEDSTRTKDPADPTLFNLIVFDDPNVRNDAAKQGGSGRREEFRNVSVDPASPRFITTVLAQQSTLLRVSGALGAAAPTAATVGAAAASGTDGASLIAADVVGATNDGANTGMYALRKADLFNLLVIPPLTPTTVDNGISPVWAEAARFCRDRRAFLIVDAPSDWSVAAAAAGIGAYSGVERAYSAIYFPRIRQPDPLQDNALQDYAPSGAIAGIMSRTDAERGVWKAPAGTDASLRGVLGYSVAGVPGTLTDAENGTLNPLGVNCLRSFPTIGNVVWGARTLEGADALASQWKYVPVRRLALFIEESLFRGTQWVVFEPNDEPLWSQIRLNIGAFMHGLFRQGAFQGSTPRDAYLVKCDRETTTQDDINRGVVNILVGFAPLKPAEFVVIRIQQLAGQVQA